MLEQRILGDISGWLHGSIFPRRRRVPVRGPAVEPRRGTFRRTCALRQPGGSVASTSGTHVPRPDRTRLCRAREHDVPALSPSLTPEVFRSPARSPQHSAGELIHIGRINRVDFPREHRIAGQTNSRSPREVTTTKTTTTTTKTRGTIEDRLSREKCEQLA